ncbi:Ribosome biogenesis regulatory protein [Trichostrongylus colubriformis]|uniref:Ribosome biogenesis regulatory protein n=1 Tax=Trichostrongylus colubriformis TaxID=6319 RepID=A0AAN8FBL7_TRICO
MDLPHFDIKPTSVQKIVDPFVDLGHLIIVDRDTIDGDASEKLLLRARNNAQFLFNKIWELDRKTVEDAVLAILPKSSFILPREKKIPEKKEPTKWEKYAAEKGLKKKKKSKKVFDEATKEWKPTYGFKRGNDNTKDWLIEIPDNADPNKDYFAERVEKKKERVAKNETQRLKNLARQMGSKIRKGPSTDASIGVGVPPEEKSKEQLRFAVDRARTATASAGKFQRLAKGEKENVKTGKKRKFLPNEAGGEKQHAMEIWERLKNKKAKIIEEKAAAVAGPSKQEKKERKGNKPIRQKSQIHRQQWFKNKKADNKKKRGNARKQK